MAGLTEYLVSLTFYYPAKFIIFEVNLLDTFTRCEKYPSKIDISRSFIRIFAINENEEYGLYYIANCDCIYCSGLYFARSKDAQDA